ncbi:phosphoribosyltransferase-like protein [Methylophaga nitratireducenticrescens]|uniref:phosphoribosyltransferase-like protein n=1 Tax=Methylophaga nitratireducenticrescens TaxID=754476 RepID=UPI000CDC40ED|nr:hypothetical protein [Methylophaga nitratireducenticrescens]AUZ83797.1 hypothetical protein CDW43_04070 [Methylophaga nitratireducenticrescens]
MQLPENFEQFKSVVLDKIKTYCDSNIWPFDYEDFSGWLHNFDVDLEEYIALQLLDSLIVRSYDMAKASYSRLLFGSLRQYLIDHTTLPIGSIQQWKKHLKSGSLKNQVRFAPVRLLEDQGESGGAIYRLMSSDIDTDGYSFSKSQLQPELLILVDDFIGSGSQFENFAKEFDLSDKLSKFKVIYCPLMAFSDGIQKISVEYPSLVVLAGEYIDETDSLFRGAGDQPFRNDPINTVADVRAYLEVMKDKYAPNMTNWFGFESASLPVLFEWGCPNQTPSILYMNYSRRKVNWNKLFNRRAL